MRCSTAMRGEREYAADENIRNSDARHRLHHAQERGQPAVPRRGARPRQAPRLRAHAGQQRPAVGARDAARLAARTRRMPTPSQAAMVPGAAAADAPVVARPRAAPAGCCALTLMRTRSTALVFGSGDAADAQSLASALQASDYPLHVARIEAATPEPSWPCGALRRAARHRLPAATRPARVRALAPPPAARERPRRDRPARCARLARNETTPPDHRAEPRGARRFLRSAHRGAPGPVAPRRATPSTRASCSLLANHIGSLRRAARSLRGREARPDSFQLMDIRDRRHPRHRALATRAASATNTPPRPCPARCRRAATTRSARPSTSTPSWSRAPPFTAPRHENRRTWLYRRQPSVVSGPLPAPRAGALDHRRRPRDRAAARAAALASACRSTARREADFVDGMHTIAANGDAESQTGVGLADVPGRPLDGTSAPSSTPTARCWWCRSRAGCVITTELGVLEVKPGEIALLPRGMVFKVALPDGLSRGYVCENYGAHFRLPELGPDRLERPGQCARLPGAGGGLRSGRRRAYETGQEVRRPLLDGAD